MDPDLYFVLGLIIVVFSINLRKFTKQPDKK